MPGGGFFEFEGNLAMGKMRKLQVFKDGVWQFVFCVNPVTGIVTTKTRGMALPSDAKWAEDDLEWFGNRFGNERFRLTTE